MKNLSLFFLILIIISCSSNKEESTEFRLRKSATPIQLSKYFSSISSNLLQSDEPIGSIDKLVTTDSHILISDFNLMKSLRVFDQTGVQLAYRDDIGEGPMGLSQINDFTVFKDTVYVLDGYRRKILRFSLELETLDEIDVPIPCNNFLINHTGIFLLRQGEDAEEGRLVHYSHQMDYINTLIPSEELSTQLVFSGTNFFIPINDSSFVFYNPFYPYIWIYRNHSMEKLELNFNSQFIDVKELANMEPLEKLRFANTFENFYNLSNGVKLSDTEFLFSIRFKKKNGYLRVDLNTMEMTYMDQIKNKLMITPSTITFSGNLGNQAWYWSEQEDIEKFYYLNNSKIPSTERMQLSSDKESKFVFQLRYR
ncbi:hypothetical protein [Algoriphagus aquimarinus]|uniref:6-bladed beta-propeller n=1 Tax=Algoriphagus aquimarinus TaxID=237018 RepID=A0A5C7AU34_9BACT|nr:hypothetical protein [Algoriphagus aquimarinus]TXE12188.1 hypothetical protein ESV85_09090 [Algoriphagus aquimarinus]